MAANYVSTFRLLLLSEVRDRYRELSAEDLEVVASLLELQVQESMGMSLDDGALALQDVGAGTSIRAGGVSPDNWLTRITAFVGDIAEAIRQNLGIEETEDPTSVRPRAR